MIDDGVLFVYFCYSISHEIVCFPVHFAFVVVAAATVANDVVAVVAIFVAAVAIDVDAAVVVAVAVVAADDEYLR